MINSKQGVFFLGLLLLALVFLSPSSGISQCECSLDVPCYTDYVCYTDAYEYSEQCWPVSLPDNRQLNGMCVLNCSFGGGTCKFGCDPSDIELTDFACVSPGGPSGLVCCEETEITEPICPSSRTYIDCAACVGQDSVANFTCATCCNCVTRTGGGGDTGGCNYDGYCDANERRDCDDCEFERLFAAPSPTQTIRFDSLITGFATYTSCTSRRYSSCDAITSSSVCDVCCPPPIAAVTCGNGVIDVGEGCDNSASPAFRASQDTCQEISSEYIGGNLLCTSTCSIDTSQCAVAVGASCELYANSGDCVQNSACRWCPIPANTLIEGGEYAPDDYTAYAYSVPGQPEGATRWCVNVTKNDPFNCGACGFSEAGTHIYNNAGGGFCNSTKPFCAQGVCRARYESGTAEASAAYRALYQGQLNSFYFPYMVSYDRDFNLYKANVVEVANYTLRADMADLVATGAVCSQVAGSGAYFPGEGCCGDYKCRSFGNICDITKICNGSVWLNATDPAMAGTVFKTARCFSTYPIAAINNEFVKCIDDNKYADYVSRMANDISGSCTPSTRDQPMQPTGSWQYSCPLSTYLAAGVSGNASYSCDVDDVYAYAKGYLVCSISNPASAARNASGFVSIINSNEYYGGVAFQNLPSIPGQSTYAYCPAPLSSWKRPGGLGGPIEPQLGAIIPCPGMTNISTFILQGVPLSLALTGVGGGDGAGAKGDYIGLFCAEGLTNQADSGETGLYALDYVEGTGNIMGAVNGRQYICHTPPPTSSQNLASYRAQIGICCGDTLVGCDDSIPGSIGSGGRRYTAGQYINSSSGGRIYCNSDGTWGNDFDSPEDQAACALSYNATGTYCCSEEDDSVLWWKESYSDTGSVVGGCFKSVFQRNNRNLSYNGVSYSNILVVDGGFLGCGFNDALFQGEYNLNNPSLCIPGAGGRLSQECLQNIEDWPNPGNGTTFRTNQPLIKSQDYCSYITVNSNLYFCSYNNAWNRTNVDSLRNSVVPTSLFNYFRTEYSSSGGNPSDLTPANCCLAGQCWNPLTRACEAAVADMNMGRYEISSSEIYKCVGGEWTNIALGVAKMTPDGCDSGYCPESNQCLYSLTGDPAQNNNVSLRANPQCIRDGQYLEDYVCRNGIWTTRTKLLALKLSSLVSDVYNPPTNYPDNYQMMCAPAEQSLNNLQSQGPLLTNAFCILNWNNQRIVATTINKPLVAANHDDFITYLEQSFWMSYPRPPNFPYDYGTIFDYSRCPPSTNFEECISITDSRGKSYLKLYYDNDYGIVVMSNQALNLGPTIGQTLCSSASFPSWLRWLCPVPGGVEEIISEMRSFNKVFVSKHYLTGDAFLTREVYGVAERLCNPVSRFRPWVYSFNYSGHLSSVDLSYLVSFVRADSVSFTPVGSGGHVVINNPHQVDPWVPLTLFRNLGQQ